MSTLVLDKKTVDSMLSMSATITATERAFREWTEGKGTMPAKAYLTLKEGDFRAMPAALPGGAGVKWVNVHPKNPSRGLPTVMAILIYNDPDTGYPLAVMDATSITAYRTGATAAIASKYLARPGARTIGLIGAGRQAYTQVMAHAELFAFDLIRIYDVDSAAANRLAISLPQFKTKVSSLAEAASSDIICTVTPARAPVVKKQYIHPGVHINAIGADAEGKEELEPDILKGAVVVVDDLRQASKSGEINVPIAKGLYAASDVYTTLGEIIAGHKPGRTDPDAVTIFDSTGVAIEDIAIARMIYEQAKGGDFPRFDFV
jgi:alanine dehydrogenase